MRLMFAAVPLLTLLLPAVAEAQVPGSYQRSCTDISQNGSILIARCRGSNGQLNQTTIDTDQCGRSDIGNAYGRLACGTVRGTSRAVQGGDPGRQGQRPYDGGDDNRPQRYGDQQGYGQPQGYGAPRPRYVQPDADEGYDPPPPPRRRPRYDPDENY